mmetsp:Transcript_14/g.51  ORF Transcript_14/g.51 Transcript_14/m.51 type:complete len:239 (-) Transcript_14:1299-2015(-)
MHLITGPMQFVVQLAAVTIRVLGSTSSSLQPTTTLTAPLTGADTRTLWTLFSKYACSLASSLNLPEHSSTSSTPASAHATSPGVLQEEYEIFCFESTTIQPSTTSTDLPNFPWIESNSSRYADTVTSALSSFTCTTSQISDSSKNRVASRPMRPKPFTPTLTFAILSSLRERSPSDSPIACSLSGFALLLHRLQLKISVASNFNRIASLRFSLIFIPLLLVTLTRQLASLRRLQAKHF